MPEKKETVAVEGLGASQIIAMALGTFEKLNWNTKYAGDNILVAYTPKSWNKWDLEITAESTDGELTITSKQVHNEAFDMAGRNKKRIAEFLSAFSEVKTGTTDNNIQEWATKINGLQQQTIIAAQEEVKQAEEINKVLNLSAGNLYVTYGIIGINVMVFALMAFSGVDIMSPTVIDIIKWGGNHKDYTHAGEWWRIFTSMFEHIGILHLLLNMYALYSLAAYLEPMLGKIRYVSAYLTTGIAAGLISLWWHKDLDIVSAGASGAIFGMYGVMLALLLTNLIPKHVRNGLLQSILIFVGYNIFYGLKPNSGIDNSAHIGGFVSGLAVGFLFYFSLRKKESGNSGLSLSAGFLAVAAIAIYLVVGSGEKNDDAKFNRSLNKFSEMELKALSPYRDTTLTNTQLFEALRNESLPAWKKAEEALTTVSEEKLSTKVKEKYKDFLEYCRLRIQETELRVKSWSEDTNNYDDEIEELNKKIVAIINRLNPVGK